MTKSVRAITMGKPMCFVETNPCVQDFALPPRLATPALKAKLYHVQHQPVRLVYFYTSDTLTIWKSFLSDLHTKQESLNSNYFDIENLARLAEEESYTMPRGLTREQRREWAKRNLNR
ncbi:hypothetical protein [Acinetobacter venetianus]|nr:hypothetical protein [Acinetobacter venetianus]